MHPRMTWMHNWKKALHGFVELVKTSLLIYKTLYFDQYSRFAISLNIFRPLIRKQI